MNLTVDNKQPLLIVIADDDEDDRFLTQKALRQCDFSHKLHFCEDGVELLDFLNNCLAQNPAVKTSKSCPVPSLILLDLNMPRKNGFETLAAIRKHPTMYYIPVIVFTTSHSEEDINRCYELGANAFLSKPASFEEMTSNIASLLSFWLNMAKLPTLKKHHPCLRSSE